MSEKSKISIFWFRRDLRLQDNVGLSFVLAQQEKVLPIFIFDTSILGALKNRSDLRVQFIHQTLCDLNLKLQQVGSGLEVYFGSPLEVFSEILSKHRVFRVVCNHDYEPKAIDRDQSVQAFLESRGVELMTFKDQVIFEKDEVVKQDGGPYTVFTPYSRKWKSQLEASLLKPHNCELSAERFVPQKRQGIISLEQLGFEKTDFIYPPTVISKKTILDYKSQRDFPSQSGTTRLGVHLRFGTVSIRRLVALTWSIAEMESWLNELIWREFFMQILFHFPHVVDRAFRSEYDAIVWRNDEMEFQAWKNGQTGFPLVDAGMRELNATGFMHNRVRMLAASFLTKHLLVDWRWGEAYFAEKLLDYDLAANNGNWQWAAGTGCDAAPYFRVFSPEAQAKKFDPEATYIKTWVPEFGSSLYVAPIVDHKYARLRVLRAYKVALAKR